MPPKIRCTLKQRKYLADYMATNPKFATRQFEGPTGKERYEREWESLATCLNDLGPEKPVKAWQTTWKDMTRKTRQKNADIHRKLNVTGNQHQIPELNDEECLVLQAIGRESSEGVGPEESQIGDAESRRYTNIGGVQNV